MTTSSSPSNSSALMEGLTPEEIRAAIEQMECHGHDLVFNTTMDFSMAFASIEEGK